MRHLNLLLIVPILFASDCGGVSSLGPLTESGGNSNGNNTSGAGFTGIGGECICDLNVATGGTIPAGGNRGSGCAGSLETIQSNTGLCLAKMATITAPSGYPNYSIDVTEVTEGQYDEWLATNPALPASTDANCGNVTSYAEQGAGYIGTDAEHHPVVYVNWCDAYAYCSGVGKRLCGAIGGGPITIVPGSHDATADQWYRACSSGGTYMYPYGNTGNASYCNGWDYWNDNTSTMQTVAVGSLANCVTFATGFSGVYDLSGNVFEWVDGCNGTGQTSTCAYYGGSFTDMITSCGDTLLDTRYASSSDIGFRCCSQ